MSGSPCSYVLLLQVVGALERPVGTLAAPGPAYHARALGARLADRRRAWDSLRRAAHRPLHPAAVGRRVLRRVLSQCPAARLDVLLVLRRAAAAAARRPGLAVQPWRRVLGG